ncbi:MAG: hypothetical protein QM757_01040 [Paludibaculum sp.]
MDAKLTIVDYSGLTPGSYDISGQRFDFGKYQGLETALLESISLKMLRWR